MNYAHAQKLIEERLIRSGVSPEVAASESGRLLAGFIGLGWISPRILDAWEKGAHIHDLRGKGLSCTIIGVRMSIRRERVVEAVRRHIQSRRAWFKETA
jgi:hypothetical protein